MSQPVPHEERLSYSYQQAAERVGCSASTIRRAIADGYLTNFTLAGTNKLLIARESLEEWVNRSKDEG